MRLVWTFLRSRAVLLSRPRRRMTISPRATRRFPQSRRWESSNAPVETLDATAGIDAALKLDAFYTQAINSDAAFEGTLDLPMKKPEGADLAFARLGGWTQDLGPIDDQEVIVTLIKGNRVMIASAPASPTVPKIAACGAVWTAANAAAQKFQEAYQASDLKDETAFDAANAALEKGDADYRACMGEHLSADPAFPALLARAQALADHMAGK